MSDCKDIDKLKVKTKKKEKKKPKLLLTKGFGCENSKTDFFLVKSLFRTVVNKESILFCFRKARNAHNV